MRGVTTPIALRVKIAVDRVNPLESNPGRKPSLRARVRVGGSPGFRAMVRVRVRVGVREG